MPGPFRVEPILGAGAMGEVWAAIDPRLGRRVAVKVLAADQADDEGARRRLASLEESSTLMVASGLGVSP